MLKILGVIYTDSRLVLVTKFSLTIGMGMNNLVGQFHMRKLKMLLLKVSQDLETTLDYESTIFKVSCKTN